MLEDALDVAVGSAPGECVLYWADAPESRPGFELPDGVVARDQAGADLGQRLARTFQELLVGSGDRAVAIGADCPDMGPGFIREAFDALTACDLVLGPANDGGYVLIGLRRVEPTLFEDIAWGTDRVLEQTLERAERAGLRTALLGGLADLDTADDLVRFVARRTLAAGTGGGHTEAALRLMGLLPPRS